MKFNKRSKIWIGNIWIGVKDQYRDKWLDFVRHPSIKQSKRKSTKGL